MFLSTGHEGVEVGSGLGIESNEVISVVDGVGVGVGSGLGVGSSEAISVVGRIEGWGFVKKRKLINAMKPRLIREIVKRL